MINMNNELVLKYRELQDRIDQLQNGECNTADVKKMSASFGVYAEKDGNYMARVRRLNGELSPKEIDDTVDIMKNHHISHVHFSSRRNMQLHGVPSRSVYSTLVDFGEKGMVFKGGGGNTFRSVAGSPYAGFSRTEVFDTTPYMDAVWDYIFSYEKAFQLGRKFKLGFSSEPWDEANCAVQDLGLQAVVRQEQRGFKVYGGGGLGRDASLGIELVPFLPEERAVQAVTAAIDLFFDHGDRENRSKARFRFVRQKMGDDAFRRLYLEYLGESDAPLLHDLEQNDYTDMVSALVKFKDPSPDCEAFRSWRERSVQDTRFDDVCSVRLFVRKGIFKHKHLSQLSSALREVGAPVFA